ncbi:DUF1796 family putative cysteine peptidase [Paenibacillus gansuensis]|uniref:DUF1796 family putative cysteine peptidase n=1 Tax=Paenibacillus gansuensis TaxID=306542 RepID=A0ABW5PE07_9BACL
MQNIDRSEHNKMDRIRTSKKDGSAANRGEHRMMVRSLSSYKDIISLGSSCQTAYQLRRLQLRTFAGPVDWNITQSAAGLIRLLEQRFQHFMDPGQVQMIGRAQLHYVIRDTAYQVDSYHDFPFTVPDHLWNQNYGQYKAKVDRRVQRFLHTLQSSSSLLLVRTATTKEQGEAIQKALHPMIKTANYLLLLVNDHEDQGRQDVIYNRWGNQHLHEAILPKGADWRGEDRAWTQLFFG